MIVDNHIKYLGTNNQIGFQNSAHRFIFWQEIGSYNVFESTLLPTIFALERNNDEYTIIQYFGNIDGDILGEIATWIAENQ